MLCEKVLGKLSDEKFKNLNVDYVDIDWYDAFKKLHKKVSDEGREVGIRLDNDILTKGLNQDDVLGVDGDTVIAVNIPPCDVIVAKVAENHHILCLRYAMKLVTDTQHYFMATHLLNILHLLISLCLICSTKYMV